MNLYAKSERKVFQQILSLSEALPLVSNLSFIGHYNHQFERFILSICNFCLGLRYTKPGLQRGGGGGRGSSVGRARDSWWGDPGFDPRCGRPLPTGWVGDSIMWPAETEVMVS